MNGKRIILIGILAAFVTSAVAVDVTVNSTQAEVAGSNYQTIGAALTYVQGQAAPRTVRITGGGPYTEAAGIEIDFTLTMYGDGYRPLIICGPTATTGVTASNQGNGIYLFVPDTAPADEHIDVFLKNFMLIPDKTNPPGNQGIRSNTDATGLSGTATMSIYLEDILITANDGNDQPVTTDGFTPDTAPAGIVRFGGRGMYFSGHLNDLCTTGVISSWSTIDGAAYVPDDYTGRTLYNPNHIGPGCVFSYNGRNGVYTNSDGTPDEFNGTADKPIWVYRNRLDNTVWGNWQGAFGIWHDDNNRPECVVTMNYVNIVGNNEIAFFTGYVDADASLPALNANHCFIANNNGAGIYISGELPGGSGGVSEFKRDWLFENCTLANNGPEATDETTASRAITGPLSVVSSAFLNPATGTMTFRDCILAGTGTAASAGDNTINLEKPLTVNIENSGLVFAGPLALSGYNLGTGVSAPTLTSVLNVDPMFIDIADAMSIDFFAVDNPAYGGAGTGGTDLSGAGRYVGSYTPPASANTWEMYE